jgi:uncharacterized repeat protein (TIGR03833 family)
LNALDALAIARYADASGRTRNKSMSITKRSDIRIGARVQVVEKQNQRTGALTEGIVARILTPSSNHPRGIKVMLEDGRVGRVQKILTENDSK